MSSCQLPVDLNSGGQDPAAPWDWSEEYLRSAVDQVRAGAELNPERWPGGAKVAALLSYDVDNETVVGLRTGEVSIGPLSQGQYGHRAALPRIVDFMDEENIPATVFFSAWSLKLAPQQAQIIKASGRHEIAVHEWIQVLILH